MILNTFSSFISYTFKKRIFLGAMKNSGCTDKKTEKCLYPVFLAYTFNCLTLKWRGRGSVFSHISLLSGHFFFFLTGIICNPHPHWYAFPIFFSNVCVFIIFYCEPNFIEKTLGKWFFKFHRNCETNIGNLAAILKR